MVVTMNKKHVSRKLKSAWRKHIDISDVDQFLEEQRQDERAGRFEDKPDAELFSIDEKPGRPKMTLREIRKKKFTELPASLLPLVNTSCVPDPIAKRNIKKNRNPIAPKAAAAVKFRKLSRRSGIAKATKEDIWAKDDIPEELQNEWISNEQVLHTMKNTGKTLVTNVPTKMDNALKIMPAHKKLPKAGSSYNPAIEDYMKLKHAAVLHEKAIIKKEEYLKRAVSNMFEKTSPEEQYRNKIQEMSEGLLKTEKSESEEEEPAPAEPVVVVEKRKKYVSKTKLKQRAQKLYEEKILQDEIKKLSEIDRADEINRELEKARIKAEKMAKRKMQRKVKGISMPLDFIEPEKLSGSLRTIQPLNNILATGVPKARKISVLKKTRAEVARKTRRPMTVRYTRSSHKIPLSERTE